MIKFTMTLTHAVLNQAIEVAAANYFSCYYSEKQGCTFVMSTGTTVIPVKESPEQVTEEYGKAARNIYKTTLQATNAEG